VVVYSTFRYEPPETTSVSKPPGPPSIPPLIEPPGSNTNWSRLSAAPTSCSKPANASAPTVPEPAPVTVHVLSPTGPSSLSFVPPAESCVTPVKVTEASAPPAMLPVPPSQLHEEPGPETTVIEPLPPPLKLIGSASAPPERSIVSAPPPAIASESTVPSTRLLEPDASVTTRSEPETATVVGRPSVLTSQGAGGEGPLPGTAAGSGGGRLTPVGAEVLAPALDKVVAVPPGVAGAVLVLFVAEAVPSPAPSFPDCGEGVAS